MNTTFSPVWYVTSSPIGVPWLYYVLWAEGDWEVMLMEQVSLQMYWYRSTCLSIRWIGQLTYYSVLTGILMALLAWHVFTELLITCFDSHSHQREKVRGKWFIWKSCMYSLTWRCNVTVKGKKPNIAPVPKHHGTMKTSKGIGDKEFHTNSQHQH
jgi:hypothetical protein